MADALISQLTTKADAEIIFWIEQLMQTERLPSNRSYTEGGKKRCLPKCECNRISLHEHV